MLKLIFVTIYMTLIFESLSAYVSLDCSYAETSYHTCGNIYQCTLKNHLSIYSEETAKLDSVTGTHVRHHFNEDVTAFLAFHKAIQYFPKNLDEYFKDLKSIRLKGNGLREIHQSDLKPFKNLIHLTIANNPIEVLEDGLFDYNIHLEAVGFEDSSIVHIGRYVFDHLDNLITFFSPRVSCINDYALNSRDDTFMLIQKGKQMCVNSEFTKLNSELDNLRIKICYTSVPNDDNQLKSFITLFESSKFSNFAPLKEKFQKLKTCVID